MKLIRKDRVYNTLDKEHEPAAVIESGETVRIETQLQSGSWLNSIEDPYVAKVAKKYLHPYKDFDYSGPEE